VQTALILGVTYVHFTLLLDSRVVFSFRFPLTLRLSPHFLVAMIPALFLDTFWTIVTYPSSLRLLHLGYLITSSRPSFFGLRSHANTFSLHCILTPCFLVHSALVLSEESDN
jgi:hypothetical protein